ncbi:ankyrin repeat domain-containing protein 27-like [Chironomus tepperi]|uniref:ankyrin repeat domain-containing protein 27-like n=1 Tax=Chironomus tepperi TaxID=113505 RepID=UPI00391EF949
METITYEEDLQTNPLYIRLIDKYSLLQEISINNWIVALPKRSSYSSKFLNNHEFMLSHILAPSEELPKTHFCNLVGEEVLINGTDVKIKCETAAANVHVLFEEYFYTKDSQRYKIICIDKPLSTKFSNNLTTCNDTVVKSVHQSLDLIHNLCSKQVERKIDNAIKSFNLRIQKSTDYDSLQANIKLLYEYCVNITCTKKIKEEQFLCMNMKFAVEYVLLDSIYDKIFDAIIVKQAEENEKFNKIIKKLSNITLNDLNISEPVASKIHDNFNVIRIEMLKIDSCKTSLDKLSSLKNVIDTISSTIGNVTTDILLPIMVYLVIKGNYYHWIPTLTFIQEFNLSSVLSAENQSTGSALLYILTTLEAIIYFIQTNENMCLEKNQLFHPKDINDIHSQEDYLMYIFTCIKEQNDSQLMVLLNMSYSAFKNESSVKCPSISPPCHPLCNCEKCDKKFESSTFDINQTSHEKLTMLHIASAFNSARILTILTNQGADVNARDSRGYTPLHYASQKGHQKVLFLLLHNQNNSINLRTNDDQTALILASIYGHEHCVKALLFFAEHTHTALDVNSQDKDGMTALHYATQFGYDGIVENLLEYQAKATIKNNIGKIPIDYARNSIIKKKLEEAAKYQVEELPITENEFIFVRKEDLADIFDEVT